jgi:hypothetical protein
VKYTLLSKRTGLLLPLWICPLLYGLFGPPNTK